MKVARDIPLSELTLRRYEKPLKLKDRELVRKLCLSLGLLQEGDSRDVVVDVLFVLLKSRKRKKVLTVSEIEDAVIKNRKLHKLPVLGVASSNIRRQLKRLKDLFLVEKLGKGYRITEFTTLSEIFHDRIEKFLLDSTLQRIREYLVRTDEQFL